MAVLDPEAAPVHPDEQQEPVGNRRTRNVAIASAVIAAAGLTVYACEGERFAPEPEPCYASMDVGSAADSVIHLPGGRTLSGFVGRTAGGGEKIQIREGYIGDVVFAKTLTATEIAEHPTLDYEFDKGPEGTLHLRVGETAVVTSCK